jgi:hypothetical protein
MTSFEIIFLVGVLCYIVHWGLKAVGNQLLTVIVNWPLVYILLHAFIDDPTFLQALSSSLLFTMIQRKS